MALKVCTQLKDCEHGVQIEKRLSTHTQQSPFVQISLLQFYMHCGDMKNAERIYSIIEDKSNRMYTILFKCFTVNNIRAKEIGMKSFDKMSKCYYKNLFVSTTALDMLLSFGETNRAEKVFGLMKEKNTFSFGAMLKGYVRNDMNDKALNLFEQMRISQDDVIRTLVFKACSQLNNQRAQTVGRQLLDQILKKSQIQTTTLNSAIHMLMCIGDTDRAEQFFNH